MTEPLHDAPAPEAVRRRGAGPRAAALRALKITGLVSALLATGYTSTVYGMAGAPAPAPAPAPVPVDPPPVPEGLKGIPVPTPSNLNDFVLNKTAAIRLGKALFWDMQLGSDGKTACATCHFHAGADNRSRNAISPGIDRRSTLNTPNPDTTFQVGGPNYQVRASDFPFHKFADPKNRDSAVLSTNNDVVSSAGVFNTRFVSALPGAVADTTNPAGDTTHQVGGVQTRKIEPRNSPTMINAIFNFRQFWDGRAQYLFNGVTPFGALDSAARVYKKTGTLITSVDPVQVRIDNASLASLATGPALSEFEMSGAGRTWPEIGVRLLSARALVQQQVSSTDSALAVKRHASGLGLTDTYEAMVKESFKPEWWSGSQKVTINGKQYTQAQANFSLFFGLAIQMYGATLVSDDSPFDRLMAGQANALTPTQSAGMGLFFGKAKCADCHGGAEFTTASVRNILKGPLNRMVMGDGTTAVYDEGFYNTAVRQTLEDIANGAKNPLGRPMAASALAQQVGPAEFRRLIGIPANLAVAPGERIAVNGAFKTSTIRNVELTAPYFHNGGTLTLRQVVEFYNRGGDHFKNNIADVDAEILPLGLTDAEMDSLVEFMKSLTDDRVRYERAPFDHPQITIHNGHAGTTDSVKNEGNGLAVSNFTVIPAVGSGGLGQAPRGFLDERFFKLVVRHSGKCVDVRGGDDASGTPVQQFDCKSDGKNDNQLWEEVPVADGFMLRSKDNGKCLDLSAISFAAGAKMQVWSCTGGANQVFRWASGRLQVRHSGQCLNVPGASIDNGLQMIQWPCNGTVGNDEFRADFGPSLAVSPEGASLKAKQSGVLVDKFKASWSFGYTERASAGFDLLRNNTATGGFADMLQIASDGTAWARVRDGSWWAYVGSTWVKQAGTP